MKELDSKQRAFVVYAAKLLKCDSGDELNDKIQSLSTDELNQLATSFDTIYNQQMENGTVMARLGAKLNYIKKLNNKCPEGYEVEMFKAGGKTCMRCIKNNAGAIPVAAHKNGSKVMSDIKSEIEAKRCGGKAKKKKAECGAKIEKDCGGSKMKACSGAKMKSACGGKKLLQKGGEVKKNYNETEHAKLIKAYQAGKVKENSKEHKRLQELNRNQPNHDPAWSPSEKQVKTAKENIKKKLLGGIL